MANILIAYFSDYGEAMYDAITKILFENGNNIFRFNINCKEVSITKWGGESKINDLNLLEDIKKFNPNIIFNFNNCLPKNCYSILNKECKICVIDADAPSVAFWNKSVIKEYFNHFVFLGLQSYSKVMYEKYLEKALTNKNYLYFPPATIVQKENLKQTKNISFIGSNFYPLSIPQGEDFYSDESIALYKAFQRNYFLTITEAKKILKNSSNIDWVYEHVRAFYAGQERLRYMQQLTDLGFTFYGLRHWNKIAYYDFELAKCFDPTPKITLEENQRVYNTSKISVNFSHPLAKSSFSWRVMDIMASNSCLLMEDKPDWIELFGKFLSQRTIDAIIYKDRFDMRQKALNLLKNESLRLNCVAELNNAIEKNGRWEIRFKTLEKFINIKLLNLDNINPNIIFIKRKESIQNNNQNKKQLYFNLKLTNRIKLFFYSICLAIAQIPILDFLQRKSRRKKLLKKIQKWWR